MLRRPSYILPLIVLSQFAGTSLWFAGNAVLPDMQRHLSLQLISPGTITSMVQLGFISGTLVFALLAIADRFAPSKVFFVCSLLAALANAAIVWTPPDIYLLMSFRFLTGFFLAGIYPVGMKIAADWYEQGLGKALGYLVGALVLGTAFPHLLKGSAYQLPWREVLLVTSLVAAAGGLLLVLLVPSGPFRKKGTRFHPAALVHIFRSKDFRAAAGGYLGHMWELYTFWAFVPLLLHLHCLYTKTDLNVPLLSFFIIGIGSVSCVAGGYISRKAGSAQVAFYALLLSGICCSVYWYFVQTSHVLFLLFMLVWGIAVIADSPQFSALVAQTAPPENKGTALTIVTSIGFAITIVSIQCMDLLFTRFQSVYTFIMLAIGPAAGLLTMYRLIKRKIILKRTENK